MRLGYELRTISVQVLYLLLMSCVSWNVLDCTLGKALFTSDGVIVRSNALRRHSIQCWVRTILAQPLIGYGISCKFTSQKRLDHAAVTTVRKYQWLPSQQRKSACSHTWPLWIRWSLASLPYSWAQGSRHLENCQPVWQMENRNGKPGAGRHVSPLSAFHWSAQIIQPLLSSTGQRWKILLPGGELKGRKL